MARTSKARKNETSFGSVEGLTFGEARYARSKLDRLMTPLVRTEILSSVDDEGISSVRSIQTTQRMKLNHPDSIPFERAVEARRYLKRVFDIVEIAEYENLLDSQLVSYANDLYRTLNKELAKKLSR